jgi:hypothetical protein
VVDLHAWLGEEFFDVAVAPAKRRYQRTASTMTSGGKRKPAKAERAMGAGEGDRFSCRQCRCSHAVTANATAPEHKTRALIPCELACRSA